MELSSLAILALVAAAIVLAILFTFVGDAMDFGACGRSQNQHFHFGRDEARQAALSIR